MPTKADLRPFHSPTLVCGCIKLRKRTEQFCAVLLIFNESRFLGYRIGLLELMPNIQRKGSFSLSCHPNSTS